MPRFQVKVGDIVEKVNSVIHGGCGKGDRAKVIEVFVNQGDPYSFRTDKKPSDKCYASSKYWKIVENKRNYKQERFEKILNAPVSLKGIKL